MPLLACESLFFLSGLKSTGPLIRMIIAIIFGIQGVILILAVMIVFWAGSYTVLLEDQSEGGFDGYDESLLSVFGFLFGDYDVGVFDNSVSPGLSKLLIALFLFFVVIVLLNLLIALMGNIYGEIQAKASSEYIYGIAKLVHEYESLIPESTKKQMEKEWYPRYLFVLRNETLFGGDKDDDVKVLKKKIEDLAKSNEELTKSNAEILKLVRSLNEN